jgi:hypothetical protein
MLLGEGAGESESEAIHSVPAQAFDARSGVEWDHVPQGSPLDPRLISIL